MLDTVFMSVTQAPPASFLDSLEPDDEKALRSLAMTRRFRAGETLAHQGEPPGRVMVILEGRVKVAASTEDGTEVVLSFKGPGELLGEVAAADLEPRCAAVRALEPVVVLALARDDFERFLAQHPAVSLQVLRVVTARLRDADRQQMQFAAHRTIERVAGRLLDLSERFGELVDRGVRIGLPLTQEELASSVGASRESTTQALQTLRSLGLVETHRRHITVVDADALRRLTG
jgi:CRP/FNR family transcriptional regulator, cyclic AMP receptor protein